MGYKHVIEYCSFNMLSYKENDSLFSNKINIIAQIHELITS